MLNLIDSFKLLKGATISNYKIVKSEKDLDSLNFPYYMKVSVSGHKTELGGMKKCNNLDEAKKNFKEMRKNFAKEDIIMQEPVDGVEIILGIKEDNVFGKLLLIGFGGIFAESVKDISFRALPIERSEIEKMIKELKLYPVLVSRKKFAIDKFVDLAEKVSKLNIKEADFNPVILNEKDAFIVDARIQLWLLSFTSIEFNSRRESEIKD